MRSYSKATKKENSMSKSCTGGKHGQAAAGKKEKVGGVEIRSRPGKWNEGSLLVLVRDRVMMTGGSVYMWIWSGSERATKMDGLNAP